MAPLVEQLLEAHQQSSAPKPRRSSSRVAPSTSSYEALKSVGERTRVQTPRMISWQQSADRCLEKFQPREFRKDDLRPYYHLSLKDAAVQLGICATTLKRVCRRLGIRKWPRRALARLSQQGSARRPEANHQLQQAYPEPQSPKLETCGSGSSSATVICKGSQSPPEALSPWVQLGCSEEFDLHDIADDPSHEYSPAAAQMPAVHHSNDWNDPLPFALDSWELDGMPEVKLRQAHMGSGCYTPHQQAHFHDTVNPVDMMGSHTAKLSWEDIPGSLQVPSGSLADPQHDMPCDSDQPCFTDSWSDLAFLQRALKQPDLAMDQPSQQSGVHSAHQLNQPAAQHTSIHASFPSALWDGYDDKLEITPARLPPAMMPPTHMPTQDVQGARFAASFNLDWPLMPTPDNSMDHDNLDCGPQHGPPPIAGPILRGRVINPDEYRVQASSHRSRF